MDNVLLISTLLLAITITLFLSWLVIKTLKEGKEAIREMKKDSK